MEILKKKEWKKFGRRVVYRIARIEENVLTQYINDSHLSPNSTPCFSSFPLLPLPRRESTAARHAMGGSQSEAVSEVKMMSSSSSSSSSSMSVFNHQLTPARNNITARHF